MLGCVGILLIVTGLYRLPFAGTRKHAVTAPAMRRSPDADRRAATDALQVMRRLKSVTTGDLSHGDSAPRLLDTGKHGPPSGWGESGLGVSLVVLAILLGVFESRSRSATEEKKGWTIALLREQAHTATGHIEARKVAAKVQGSTSDLEREALALLVGPRELLETFLHLTDHVNIRLQGDPLEDPVQWKGWGRPSDEQIEEIAVIRVLRDREYVSGVLPAGYGDYAVVASNEALALRTAFDRLPATLKNKVRKEQPGENSARL
ncbi:MAG: hypothetical protein ACE5MM_03545 [Nitrospiraceae bacterium]